MQLHHIQRKPLRKEENIGLEKREKGKTEEEDKKRKIKKEEKENEKDGNNPLTTSWYVCSLRSGTHYSSICFAMELSHMAWSIYNEGLM